MVFKINLHSTYLADIIPINFYITIPDIDVSLQIDAKNFKGRFG